MWNRPGKSLERHLAARMAVSEMPMGLFDMSETGYWFKCPLCGELAVIDSDQAAGRVSMVCPDEACSFHETGTVQPLVLSTQPMKPEDAPTWLRRVAEAHAEGGDDE